MGTFDAGKAASWLIQNSHSSSIGRCAKYVRMGIEAGGISTAGRPVAAQEYVNFLPRIGFNQIGSGSPQVGDICVINHGKYGHISMYCGSQWISDFKQRGPIVYSSGINGVWYFRYNGQINNSGIANASGTIYDNVNMKYEYIPMNVNVLKSEPDEMLAKCTFIKRGLMKEVLYYIGTEEFEKMEDEKENEIDSIQYDNEAWKEDYLENLSDKERKEQKNELSLDYGIGSLIQQYYKIGKMGTQVMTNLGDISGGVDMSGIDGSDALKIAQQVLSREERGKPYETPCTGNELYGIYLDKEKHKTYGFGQVYTSNGKLWEQINGGGPFTDQILRDDFNRMLVNELKAVNTIKVPLSPWQKAVLMHRYHFGPAAFKYIKNKIDALGRTPSAQEYGEFSLQYCRSCSNWSTFGRGWTNGVRREMVDWDRK